jgi:hypothetical protein
MRLDAAELDRRTRETLARLLAGGPALSLAICGDLIDLGHSPPAAWQMVESALPPAGTVGKSAGSLANRHLSTVRILAPERKILRRTNG